MFEKEHDFFALWEDWKRKFYAYAAAEKKRESVAEILQFRNVGQLIETK